MIKYVKNIFGLFIVGIILIGGIVLIWWLPNNLTKLIGETGKESKVLESISTGYVIAYGSYIAPPYTEEIQGQALMVNKIQVYPARQTFNNDKVEVTEDIIKKSEIIQAIFDNYREWRTAYGLEQAQSLLKEYLARQELISKFEFAEEGEDCTIYYWDGTIENLLLHSVVFPNKQKAGKEIDLSQQIKEKKEKLIEDLRGGNLVALGDGYLIVVPASRAADYLKGIEGAVRNRVEATSTLNLVNKIVNNKELAKDIIKNKELWLK